MTERMKYLFLPGMALLLVAALAALVFLFPVTRPARPERLAEDRPAYAAAADELPAASDEKAPAETFILRDLNGYIAVYRLPETGRPDAITGIATRTLRRVDYLELQTGIRVEGWEGLARALEDFGP